MIEVLATFFFLYVIIGTTSKGAAVGFAGIPIGLCLTLIHLFLIPVTNASVNPARSTGPALFAGGAYMKTAKRKDEVAILGGGPNRLEPLPGARNIRTLSARYIADLQEDWEIHGKKALAIYREKFPDRYVENYTMLAKVIRLEADVKHSLATPKTMDEALAQLESKVGKDGRQKFEKFLRSMGEELDDDDEDDLIDVDLK